MLFVYIFLCFVYLVIEEEKDDGVMRIYFDPPHYTVMESIGTFMTTIVRKGGDLSLPVCVDYKTEDGTACSPDDYTGVSGTLTFGPGVTEQQVLGIAIVVCIRLVSCGCLPKDRAGISCCYESESINVNNWSCARYLHE